MSKIIPRYIVLWRQNKQNYWEAVSDDRFANFIGKLVANGTNPASIIVSTGAMCNWLFPEYHKKKRTVWMRDIYDEINGTSNPSDYSGPDVPTEKKEKIESLYGFISPDGRYFQCAYGGHSELARRIVGEVQPCKDAQQFLENRGWLVIYHDPFGRGKYAAGTGYGKKITDEQLKTFERIGLQTTIPGIKEILGGEADE